MRKQCAVMLCLVLVFLLASCGRETGIVTNPTLKRADYEKKEEGNISVGFIQTGKESDWRDANTNNFLNVFTESMGFRLVYVDGNSDPKRQIKAMYDLIAQKMDYIILDPIVEDGWEDALRTAKEEGIPVIISDREVSADPSLYTCWIGSDFEKEGESAIQCLEDYLEERDRLDDPLKIVILEGTEGATAAIGRTKGIEKGIARHKKWEVVAKECGNFTQGEGKQVMEKILEEHDDFDVLISENDNMMFGAMDAMDDAGVSFGVDKDVITISFDALREAFKEMTAKRLIATIECNPLLANTARQVIDKLESGQKVKKKTYTEESVFTYKNVAGVVPSRPY